MKASQSSFAPSAYNFGVRFVVSPTIALLIVSACSANAQAETVHQTVAADKLSTGDGGNAAAKGATEVKKIDGTDGGTIARYKGTMPQWGYVTAWFGMPAPAGESIVRLRIYVDADKPAKTLLYIRGAGEATMIGELKLPADAKPNTFVTVDVPVSAKEEWSGLVIKKAEASDAAGFWINAISVVLP